MVTVAHDIGDTRRLTAKFTDVAGVPADPTAITLTIREPDGVLVTKTIGELTNPNVGEFFFDFAITKSERHAFGWAGTATIVTAAEGEFWVRKQQAV